MVIDNEQILIDRTEKVRLGELANNGLQSDFWLEIVKPIIDSMLKGVTDITEIDISSDKKASIEIMGRKLAAKYISEIETFIRGYIMDAEAVKKVIENQNKAKSLYIEREV